MEVPKPESKESVKSFVARQLEGTGLREWEGLESLELRRLLRLGDMLLQGTEQEGALPSALDRLQDHALGVAYYEALTSRCRGRYISQGSLAHQILESAAAEDGCVGRLRDFSDSKHPRAFSKLHILGLVKMLGGDRFVVTERGHEVLEALEEVE